MGKTKFWDVKTGKVIRQLNEGRGSFGSRGCQQSLAINPTDSTQVFYASNLSVYNSSSKNKPITVSFPKEDARDSVFLFGLSYESCTAFSPDGKIIAVSSIDDLYIWQSTTGDRLYRLPAQLADDKLIDKSHTSYEYLAFSPDSQIFVSGKSDGTIQLWDMKNGKEISKTTAHSQQHIRFLGFTPDGTTLISIGGEGTIKLWEVR